MGKTLERKVFELSRECEFFTEKELTMQIGHEKAFWYVALIKELMDNSLDACEIGNIDPRIEIILTDDYFEIRDNGPGISKKTIIKSLNYLMRVLSWFSVKWNFPLLKNANVSGDSVPRPLGFLRHKR